MHGGKCMIDIHAMSELLMNGFSQAPHLADKTLIRLTYITTWTPVFADHSSLFFGQKLLEAECMLRGQKRYYHSQNRAEGGT